MMAAVSGNVCILAGLSVPLEWKLDHVSWEVIPRSMHIALVLYLPVSFDFRYKEG
jgi:hypothetical protein